MRLPLLLGLILTQISFGQTPSLSALEQEFQTSMTGVTMVGQSTRDGRPGVSEDKYSIEKVAKQGNDSWTSFVRVQYQGKDVTVPLPLQVKWAGDTPVITLTEQALPGMGTYTARVLVYKDRYAGTWSGKSGGGTVFGRITRP